MRRAAPRRSDDGGETWISARIAASYRELHRLGHAHSIECWIDGALVGGLYGVGFERVFCGESMFSRVPEASKVALAWLVVGDAHGRGRIARLPVHQPAIWPRWARWRSAKRYLALLRDAMRPKEPGIRDLRPQSGMAGSTGAGVGSAAGGALSLPDAFGALLGAAKSAGSLPRRGSSSRNP
jgi:leucyl/phenylalanyl-tRNA--protein transferase